MTTRIDYARQLAASLSYIALNNLDRLTIYGLSDKLHTVMRPAHGRSHIFPMLEALQNAECYGHGTSFEKCIKTFQARGQRRGMCVLISDFFAQGTVLKKPLICCYGAVMMSSACKSAIRKMKNATGAAILIFNALKTGRAETRNRRPGRSRPLR